jgi:predicted RNase H-like nuclease (RuvC/YqgF family)
VEEIRIYDEKFRIKEGDIVYFKDASGGGTTTAHEVARHKVTCILVSGSMSHLARTVFEEVGIPVFNAEEFEMRCVENYGVMKAEKFEEKVKEWRMKKSIDEAKKASKNLRTIIEEYKKERNEEISDHLEE